MQPTIRIGTRDSQLALWQAKYIQARIEQAGYPTELVLIKSEGELNLTSPLYELGVQGIFTKTLDLALLQNKIDIAVHSLKDVPTQVAQGLYHAATPVRGNHKDILALKSSTVPNFDEPLTIASSSLRRQAQWLNKYPHHTFEPIRGNINSRLQKLLSTQHWTATVLAAAGTERIGLEVPHFLELDWMLPAPSQGALGVFCRVDDEKVRELCHTLTDENTHLCTQAERMFLRTLMGGCTMPIAAFAYIQNEEIHFKGNILSIDGSQKCEVTLVAPKAQANQLGQQAAEQILANGGQAILNQLKQQQGK